MSAAHNHQFEELLRLIREQPELREALRRELLTEELLMLPERVGQIGAMLQRLSDSQAQSDARLARVEQLLGQHAEQLVVLTAHVGDLVQRMERVEAQIEALTQRVNDLTLRMERVEAQIEALTQRVNDLTLRMERAEAQIEALTTQVRELTLTVSQLQQQVAALIETTERHGNDLAKLRGSELEWRYVRRASAYFGPLLRSMQVRAPAEIVDELEDRVTMSRDDLNDLLRTDLIVQGRPRDVPGYGPISLVIEISVVVDRNDVARAVRRATVLRALGQAAVPGVAGERITEGARQAALSQGVVVFRDGSVEGWETALLRWPPLTPSNPS